MCALQGALSDPFLVQNVSDDRASALRLQQRQTETGVFAVLAPGGTCAKVRHFGSKTAKMGLGLDREQIC